MKDLTNNTTGEEIMETFTHEKFGTLRTVVNEDNEIFFICKDIAETLEYASPDKAYKHCKSLFSLTNAKLAELIYEGFHPSTKLIKEPDLYRLIFKSHKKEAGSSKTGCVKQFYQAFVTMVAILWIRKLNLMQRL